jgi:hypothetical protein
MTYTDSQRLAFLKVVLNQSYRTIDEQALRYPETFPSEARRFCSVDRMKHAVTDSGSHYFEPDTLKWHGSRHSQTLYGNRFVVESNGKASWDIPRTYRVIWVSPGEGLLTVERSVDFSSRAIAHRVARDLARMF